MAGHTVNKESALERIAAAVGELGIVRAADAGGFLRDQRGLYRGAAALVVRPATLEECSTVVAICNDAGIGVVPQGGNTGYCGGATPFDGEREIVLSLARLNRIREVDTVGFTMTAEAGVVLARAQAAARENRLLLPLSMGSEGSCHIGGNLATNAGGLAVLRYGTARDLVLGVEAVLPNGTVLSDLKGLRKDNTGYDLRSLFIGSEGTLGVITAAVLKLYPEPRSRQTAWLALPSIGAACAVLARARDLSGDQVTSAEYIARQSLELVLEHVPAAADPFDSPHPHYMLLELASAASDDALRAVLTRVLEAAVEAGDVTDAVLAESLAQRDRLWLLRERIPEAEARAGGAVKHDVAVRIGAIPPYVEAARSALQPLAPHRLSIFGHIGDGNLHFNVLPASGARFSEAQARALTNCVHDAAVSCGGSFSAEHGIGVLKADDLGRYKQPAALDLMRAVKRAIDPNGIMNPGKVLRAPGAPGE